MGDALGQAGWGASSDGFDGSTTAAPASWFSPLATTRSRAVGAGAVGANLTVLARDNELLLTLNVRAGRMPSTRCRCANGGASRRMPASASRAREYVRKLAPR